MIRSYDDFKEELEEEGNFILGDPTIYCDVDNTLVMWPDKSPFQRTSPEQIEFKYHQNVYFLTPHKEHIEFLKIQKQQGFKIVLWSAGSETWAKEVCRILKLENIIDICLSKPMFWLDDLEKGDDVLHPHRRVYLKEK